MMLELHTCHFHVHQLRVILCGGFVKNVLHSHLQLQRHHFYNFMS